MGNPIISETSEHAAFLDGGEVRVYRKAGPYGTLVPMGVGRWEDGTILGSGVNCGVLVRLEQDLRAQTGTP
jgi:hypothetical protein